MALSNFLRGVTSAGQTVGANSIDLRAKGIRASMPTFKKPKQPDGELAQLLGSDDPQQQIARLKQLLQADIVLVLRFSPGSGVMSLTPIGGDLSGQQVRELLALASQAITQKEIEALTQLTQSRQDAKG